MTKKKEEDRRRYLRYPPDATETVMVQFSGLEQGFRPEVAALPSEESRGGLQLVMLKRPPLEGVEPGAACVVEVARLGPQRAEVRWIEMVGDDLVRLGVQLLD